MHTCQLQLFLSHFVRNISSKCLSRSYSCVASGTKEDLLGVVGEGTENNAVEKTDGTISAGALALQV